MARRGGSKQAKLRGQQAKAQSSLGLTEIVSETVRLWPVLPGTR